MWIWVVIPHHLETASYYPTIYATQGCFFHFRQALIKNLNNENDLFEKYLNNGKGKCCFALTQFSALAFVRPEHTGIGFEALLEDAYIKKHSTIFKGYLDYFK
ncbi:hypothetical protein DSO57_1021221 [Entomophthora muscae]|uniref:Uncharacterized protein n=1 Tax=Entomophthora muscae TaxID=34485 RepID=A0ACC2TF08_9FUNG|nr:hypothetical protein DSO57_1021221 [Entomophthora muscae]